MRANLFDHVNIGQANCNFPDGTNPAKLTDSTIGANQRFFEKRKGAPTCAYTMGISSILQLHSCWRRSPGTGQRSALTLLEDCYFSACKNPRLFKPGINCFRGILRGTLHSLTHVASERGKS